MPDVGKDRYVKIARRRLANLQAAQANKATTSARQRGANVTDIDSRLMMTRQGYIQGYNAQAGVNEQGVVRGRSGPRCQHFASARANAL